MRGLALGAARPRAENDDWIEVTANELKIVLCGNLSEPWHQKPATTQGFSWFGGSLFATMVGCDTGVRTPSSTMPPPSASK